jgi:hypothetical protein
MKISFFKKPKLDVAQTLLTRQIYNPFRDRIRKHISDINDVITDEDLRCINVLHITKQTNNQGDLAIG